MPLQKLSSSTDFVHKISQTQRKIIHCLNQYLHEKHHKNETKHANKRQSLLSKICNAVDPLEF